MSKGEVGGHEGYFLENEQVWEFANSDNSRTIEDELDNKMKSNLPSYTEEASEKGKETIKLVGKKRSRECSNSVKGTKGTKGDTEKNDEAGKSESDHDSHILTERERRKKMKNMFATLHSLLPHLSHKADKSTIVDEAINYISKLQNTFQKLQKQKSQRLNNSHCMNTGNKYLIQRNRIAGNSRETFLADHGSSSNNLPMSPSSSFSVPRFPVNFRSFTSQNVALSVCGDVAHISICSRKKPGLVTAISYVLEKHKLEVVSAHVSSDHITSLLMIQVHANGTQNQFPDRFQVEEIFKQAAAEMMLWVTS